MTPPKTILATLGLSLLITGAAGAQGWGRHGQEHGGGEHGEGRGGGRGRVEEGFDPRGHGRGGENGRGYDRGGRSYDRPLAGDFAPRGYPRPDYAAPPPAYGPPVRARGWDRGQFLPQAYWSGQTADPRSHRLRPPPPGYGWYGVGRDAYLVQRSTGLILDTAPGAW